MFGIECIFSYIQSEYSGCSVVRSAYLFWEQVVVCSNHTIPNYKILLD